MAGHIATAARQDWCTPKWLVDLVRRVFGGIIGLDPCSNAQSIVHAADEWFRNGLDFPWAGNVYVNPPYGRGIAKWIQKAVRERQSRFGARAVIMLIPAAVGTKFWHKWVWPYAHAICFLKGRVRFEGAETGAPMDTAVVYFGDKAGGDKFSEVFKDVGRIVRP